MLVLGLESSCDETAAAVLKDGVVLSNLIRSQVDIHCQYGGVVPEIASRAHLEAVDVISREALSAAGVTLADLDGIAVTQGPGLVGALLVALNFAKGLSLATGLPLTGVNHVKAHALSPFMVMPEEAAPPPPPFPMVALVVSGGHTNLYQVDDYLDFKPLGKTRDDAAGEAFDKIAKLMGLGYPGGHLIEELAARGKTGKVRLTRPMLKEGLDFSFSGLKTQVLMAYREGQMDSLPRNDSRLADLAAGFQDAVVDVLVTKLVAACRLSRAQGAVLAGGVAANGSLRLACEVALRREGLPLFIPPLGWCSDNAAMIAYLGGRQLAKGQSLLDLGADARPRWPVA